MGLVGKERPLRGVEKHIAKSVLPLLKVRRERVGEAVGGEHIEVAALDEIREPDDLEQFSDASRHGLASRPTTLLRGSRCAQADEVRGRCVVKLQHPRQRLEDLRRRMTIATLLESEVVVGADTGKHGNLLTPQPSDASHPTDADSDTVRLNELTARPQVLTEPVALTHLEHGNCAERNLTVPVAPRIVGALADPIHAAQSGLMTSTTLLGGTFTLADDLTVTRMGYGAMQLAGPHVFGPPADRDAAVALLHEAIDIGITHIDTSDFYGPHVTNQIIREALHPYADEVHIVTKVGALRDAEGGWPPALAPDQLRQAVHDNLDHLGLDVLDVVNFRVGGLDTPTPGSIAEPLSVLAEMQRAGLIKHLGLSNVTAEQITEAQSIAPIVCVQNFYNIAHRIDDELIDSLAAQGISYVPFFPLGGFTPLQSQELSTVATHLATTPMAVALAWLLHRAPNILLIPGTSSLAHLRENVTGAAMTLTENDLGELDRIGADPSAN